MLDIADNYSIMRDIIKATFDWGNRQHNQMKGKVMDKLIETFIVGICALTIVASSIFGTWALFQTM